MNKQELIQQLIDQAHSLQYHDQPGLDSLKKRSEMYIRNIFGESSKYLADLKRIHFSPMIYPADEAYYKESWTTGLSQLKNLYETMSEELVIFGGNSKLVDPEGKKEPPKHKKVTGKIFIVHGHNESIKNEVARFLEKLNLEAIILHERPNSGKTIIEKFEDEASDVDFAIALLTADDQGAKMETNGELKSRARQNVIFEFGYFIGIMGRSKAVALIEEGVEIPSDYSGVVYIGLDRSGAWKLSIARELKNAGIDVDLNLAI